MNTDLLKINNTVSITSLEIAELTGKEHYNVLRDIENILNELEIDKLKFEGIYKDSMNREKPMFVLSKREALILASGYSIKLRTMIIDKLEELSKPKELTRLEILQIALENEKKVLELQAINDEMKPKAEYFDALVDKNLLTNFRDTAKEFKINQNEFINFLLDKKFLYRDNKKQLKAYSKAIETGLMEYKEFINVHSKKTGLQILITPKGRETFRLLFCK